MHIRLFDNKKYLILLICNRFLCTNFFDHRRNS